MMCTIARRPQSTYHDITIIWFSRVNFGKGLSWKAILRRKLNLKAYEINSCKDIEFGKKTKTQKGIGKNADIIVLREYK